MTEPVNMKVEEVSKERRGNEDVGGRGAALKGGGEKDQDASLQTL